MATYKEIKGVTIQALDDDPIEFVGSWSTGGNLNTARRYLGGCGIQTAALGIGGYTGGGAPGRKAIVEQYDGSSWTEIADMNTVRGQGVGGCGTTTAATETADEVEVVISGTAGAGGVIALKFFGIASDSPTA